MALTPQQIHDVTAMMDAYIARIRPPEKIRHELDIGWRLENQFVFIFELRPQWKNKKVIITYDFAKATWIQTRKHWNIYWMRGNLKWDRYGPLESTVNLQRFLIEVEKDPYGCFQG